LSLVGQASRKDQPQLKSIKKIESKRHLQLKKGRSSKTELNPGQGTKKYDKPGPSSVASTVRGLFRSRATPTITSDVAKKSAPTSDTLEGHVDAHTMCRHSPGSASRSTSQEVPSRGPSTVALKVPPNLPECSIAVPIVPHQLTRSSKSGYYFNYTSDMKPEIRKYKYF